MGYISLQLITNGGVQSLFNQAAPITREVTIILRLNVICKIRWHWFWRKEEFTRILVSLETSQGKMTHSSWQVKLLCLKLWNWWRTYAPSWTAKEAYQPRLKSRRESHAGIWVQVFGVGTFCDQFSRKPLLCSRDTGHYRQRKGKSWRVQPCVHTYTSSFLENSSEPLGAVRGPKAVEMGQAEAHQRQAQPGRGGGGGYTLDNQRMVFQGSTHIEWIVNSDGERVSQADRELSSRASAFQRVTHFTRCCHEPMFRTEAFPWNLGLHGTLEKYM